MTRLVEAESPVSSSDTGNHAWVESEGFGGISFDGYVEYVPPSNGIGSNKSTTPEEGPVTLEFDPVVAARDKHRVDDIVELPPEQQFIDRVVKIETLIKAIAQGKRTSPRHFSEVYLGTTFNPGDYNNSFSLESANEGRIFTVQRPDGVTERMTFVRQLHDGTPVVTLLVLDQDSNAGGGIKDVKIIETALDGSLGRHIEITPEHMTALESRAGNNIHRTTNLDRGEITTIIGEIEATLRDEDYQHSPGERIAMYRERLRGRLGQAAGIALLYGTAIGYQVTH